MHWYLVTGVIFLRRELTAMFAGFGGGGRGDGGSVSAKLVMILRAVRLRPILSQVSSKDPGWTSSTQSFRGQNQEWRTMAMP